MSASTRDPIAAAPSGDLLAVELGQPDIDEREDAATCVTPAAG